MVAQTLLSKFIEEEMEKRGMNDNNSQFAELVGVSHTTIAYLRRGEKTPSPETLAKLARATQTDVGVLAKLVNPEVGHGLRPEIAMRAERISQLPPDLQEVADTLIDALFKQAQERKSGKKRRGV